MLLDFSSSSLLQLMVNSLFSHLTSAMYFMYVVYEHPRVLSELSQLFSFCYVSKSTETETNCKASRKICIRKSFTRVFLP